MERDRGPSALAGRPAVSSSGPSRARGAATGALATQPPNPRSQQEIVARLFDAFSRRDLDATLALVHSEIVFQPMTAAVTQQGEPYRGHAGIRRYMQDIEALWEELRVQPTQIRAAGRAVVALGVASGSGPTGAFADVPTTWVVKFKDGLVCHAQIFSDERHVRDALVGEEAAGAQ